MPTVNTNHAHRWEAVGASWERSNLRARAGLQVVRKNPVAVEHHVNFTAHVLLAKVAVVAINNCTSSLEAVDVVHGIADWRGEARRVAGAVEDRSAEGLVPAPDVIHAGRDGNLATSVDVSLELSSGCWRSCDLCGVVEHYDCLEALWNEVELAVNGCTVERLLRNRSEVRRVRDWLKQSGRNQVAELIVWSNEEVWSAAGGSLCLELREDIAERHLNGDDLDLREFLLELGELCSEGGAFS